jgi:hypothetical protein
MKKLLFCLLLLTAPPQLSAQAPAQGRQFNQAELDALLAPVALYPDALLVHVFAASTQPFDVGQAARWARANPNLSGDAAVRAAHSWGWHSSVTALTAFPDILIRMEENPQWLRDLGDAWTGYEPYVMETVQQLRRRAEAAGNLRSDDTQQVYRQDDRIYIQPVAAQVVHVAYYNPMVVFGNWWWTSYRPVAWRPWQPRPHHVHHVHQVHHAKPVHVKPVHAKPVHTKPVHPRPQVNYPQRPQIQRPAPVAIQRAIVIKHQPARAPEARPQELRQYRSISRYVKEADHAIRTNPVRASVPQRNRMAPVGARSP